jgi:predicted nucleic-acid-binding protein
MGQQTVRITTDTNILIRAAVQDEPYQARQAAKLLQDADLIAVPIPVLCEFVWVLRRGYKKSIAEIANAIRRLIKSQNVETNRTAVEVGLLVLEAGGDFADGVIAFEGESLRADEFVSFDAKAVSALRARGTSARLLS